MGTPPDFELSRSGTGTPSNRRYRYVWEEYSLTSSYVNRILTQDRYEDSSCSKRSTAAPGSNHFGIGYCREETWREERR
jgi:hypothetical protein